MTEMCGTTRVNTPGYLVQPLWGNLFPKLLDDLFRLHALGLTLIIQDKPMTQRGDHGGLEVIAVYVHPPGDGGEKLGAED